ncbi:hypothetical protein [Streptomyces sp. NPDC051214]|uniref:hypothetical protein n=1 Tax=Streptomyces sp. NPDC051214 TaxID=3155282 RepID=UPI003443326E
MAPQHRKAGARIVLGPTAARQATGFNPAEQVAVDRALAVIAADPTAGAIRPRIEQGGPMWEYRAPGTEVRIVYTLTIRRTIITVAYFEA